MQEDEQGQQKTRDRQDHEQDDVENNQATRPFIGGSERNDFPIIRARAGNDRASLPSDVLLKLHDASELFSVNARTADQHAVEISFAQE